MAVSKDNTLIVSGSADGSVKVFSAENREEIYNFNDDQGKFLLYNSTCIEQIPLLKLLYDLVEVT